MAIIDKFLLSDMKKANILTYCTPYDNFSETMGVLFCLLMIFLQYRQIGKIPSGL